MQFRPAANCAAFQSARAYKHRRSPPVGLGGRWDTIQPTEKRQAGTQTQCDSCHSWLSAWEPRSLEMCATIGWSARDAQICVAAILSEAAPTPDDTVDSRRAYSAVMQGSKSKYWGEASEASSGHCILYSSAAWLTLSQQMSLVCGF